MSSSAKIRVVLLWAGLPRGGGRHGTFGDRARQRHGACLHHVTHASSTGGHCTPTAPSPPTPAASSVTSRFGGARRRRYAWAVIFEWDPEKARTNLIKHRIAFAEASSVFLDAFALTFPDPHQLEGDEREITIGHSARGRTLFVSHCRCGERTRIISTRRATRKEREQYESGVGEGS